MVTGHRVGESLAAVTLVAGNLAAENRVVGTGRDYIRLAGIEDARQEPLLAIREDAA